MQIQASLQHTVGTLSPVPAQVLADLSVGQQVFVVVTKAALAAEVATIKLDNVLLDIKTPVAVQQGQVLQLQVTELTDKPSFQLLQSSTVTKAISPDPSRLNMGQTIPVDVIALKAGGKSILVEARLPAADIAQGKTPLRVEVDVSRLTKSFSVGERATVTVSSLSPLAITLQANNPKEEVLVARIKQLLPQLQNKPDLNQLATTLKTVSLPQSVQQPLTQLLQTVLDSKGIEQPQQLRQAILSSGGFTENQLRRSPASVTTDFKGQLLKLASAIESVLMNVSHKTTNSTTVNPPQTTAEPSKTTRPILSTGSLGQSQSQQATSASTSPPNGVTGTQTEQTMQRQAMNQQARQTPITTQTQVMTDTTVQTKTSQVVNNPILPTTSAAAATPQPSLLTAILQALGAYQSVPSAIAVLQQAPTATALPTALPAYLETMLTSQQATALAQALNRSVSPEQLRASGQFDALVLQGLLREVESLHARVQLNQLSMLKEPDTPNAPTASWLIDLPIKDKQQLDFVQLQIDQFKQQREQNDETTWQVQLRLDTQNLGPVQAVVTMHENDVNIVIKAERAESTQLLNQHLTILDQALSKLNIDVNDVSCYCGEVAEPTLAEQYLSATTNLVDISV